MELFIQSLLYPFNSIAESIDKVTNNIETPKAVKSLGKKSYDIISKFPTEILGRVIGLVLLGVVIYFGMSIVPVHITTLLGFGILFWILLCILYPLRLEEKEKTNLEKVKLNCKLGRIPDEMCETILQSDEALELTSEQIINSISSDFKEIEKYGNHSHHKN